jgi:hypothetical protein
MAVTFLDGATGVRVASYEGAVLGEFEQNFAHDSYFYAVVWDAATQAVTAVQYGTTAFHTTGRIEIDATPEARDAAHAWAVETVAEHIRREHAATVAEGVQVRSLATRGKAKGLTGRVDRVMDSKHDAARAAKSTKVALVVNDETGQRAWVPTGRLEVTTPLDDAEVTERAGRMATGRGPVSIYRMLRFR